MQKGFTLIELSIVLLIIALLVAGVTAGKGLIRAAEIQALISDFKSYQTALNTFQLKYDSLPGDMPDASEYWSTCTDISASQTCDGDGNGRINSGHEGLRAYEHMGNAGVIPGLFGTSSGTPYVWAVESKAFRQTANPVYHISDIDGGGFWPDDGYWDASVSINMGDTPGYSAEEIQRLDKKVDDGIALEGYFRILQEELDPSTGCVDASDDTAVYNLQGDSDYCHMYYSLIRSG